MRAQAAALLLAAAVPALVRARAVMAARPEWAGHPPGRLAAPRGTTHTTELAGSGLATCCGSAFSEPPRVPGRTSAS